MDDVDRRRCGSSRKLTNLKTYLRHARTRFLAATIRLLVLSNASDGLVLERLRHALGPEAADDRQLVGWKVLPLQLTGQWLGAHLDGVEDEGASANFRFRRPWLAALAPAAEPTCWAAGEAS